MRLRSWLERRGIWFYSQNLNKDSKDEIVGSKFWHGRAWLKWKDGTYGLHGEWVLGWRQDFCHVCLNIGGEYWTTFSVGIPYLAVFWFHIERPHRYQQEKEIGINLYQGLLSWRLWQDSHEWHRGIPKWRYGSFDILDFIFGKRKYTTEVLRIDRIFVKMPEECYHGNCKIYRAIWKRSRWPWPLMLTRADIEMDKPIPTPGKGENSWDQEDDAVYSMTMTASSPEEATRILRDSVLETRKRWGWRDSRAPSA